jgi:chromosome segregation ATPase
MTILAVAVQASAVAAPQTFGQWVYVLVLLVLGAGGQSVIKAVLEYRANKEANQKAGLKMDAESGSLQVQGLEILVKNLQGDNEVLRKDRDYWKEQYDVVRQQVEKVLAELDVYRSQVQELKEMLDNIQAQSPAAKAATPPSESMKRDDLWEANID